MTPLCVRKSARSTVKVWSVYFCFTFSEHFLPFFILCYILLFIRLYSRQCWKFKGCKKDHLLLNKAFQGFRKLVSRNRLLYYFFPFFWLATINENSLPFCRLYVYQFYWELNVSWFHEQFYCGFISLLPNRNWSKIVKMSRLTLRFSNKIWFYSLFEL